MKNVKKNMMIFGAVIITLLMVSSANALIIPKLKEKQNSGNNSDNSVEHGIYLSVKQKPILKTALKYVNNPDVSLFLEEIINNIDSKGFVDSSDIKQIISENSFKFKVTSGSIKTGDDQTDICGGGFFIPRRPLYFVGLILPCNFRWNAFVDLANNPVKITINGEYITYDNIGYAIFYTGHLAANLIQWTGMHIDGNAKLIIYNPK